MKTINQKQQLHSTIFEVTAIYDRNHTEPHYPHYPVINRRLGYTSSRAMGEAMIQGLGYWDKYSSYKREYYHSFRICEKPLDEWSREHENYSSYLYNREGELIDKRENEYPFGIFKGRSINDCRFRVDDLCEICSGDTICLGIVAQLPFSPSAVEEMTQLWSSPPETAVDGYGVFYEMDGQVHTEIIDALSVYPVSHPVSAKVEKVLRNHRAEYKTRPKQCQIAAITCEAELKKLADELNLDLVVNPRRDYTIEMVISGFPDSISPATFIVEMDVVFRRMGCLRRTIYKLAGRKVSGKTLDPVRLPDPDRLLYYLKIR